MGERGFTETGGAVQQDMVERLVTLCDGLDGDREAFDQVGLTDVLVDALRAQRPVDGLFLDVGARTRRDNAISCHT